MGARFKKRKAISRSPERRRRRQAYGMAAALLLATRWASGQEPYSRAGYRAALSTLAHNVSGVVTIVDEDTIRIDPFFYDGGGIVVYAYLGASNQNSDFVNGLQVGPQLRGTPFSGGALVIDLPAGRTLDGYQAVSIWCVSARMNFGSGSFLPPAYPRAGYSAVLAPGQHRTSGRATILDDRTIRLDSFTYDGRAPLVFAFLGERNRYLDFLNGQRMGPQISQEYSNGMLTVTLPPGLSLDGYGALSIWCVQFQVSFTSSAFPRAPHDLDLDGDIDPIDGERFADCLSGPSMAHLDTRLCSEADLDGDSDVDVQDYQRLQECASGPGRRADVSCGQP